MRASELQNRRECEAKRADASFLVKQRRHHDRAKAIVIQ